MSRAVTERESSSHGLEKRTGKKTLMMPRVRKVIAITKDSLSLTPSDRFVFLPVSGLQYDNHYR